MRKITALAFGATTLFSIAYAAEWSGAWKPLHATYTIYAGELSEREAPTAAMRTMTIAVEGLAAKEIFDSIGPDSHPSCSQEKGDRDRDKEGVQCTFNAKAGEKGYRCWIGINLLTGASIPTVSC
ncbi:hypothetical protein [Janthinobacterium fluminis]|uniref:Uncharacterized protein n=1 Tax=Janthinobacterium fluminis TaxID=2987524 RepID=A0ABT5K325_9BURK|nr:hypothetical protein [Janthinobacterium fluminis]MDC8759382.1 hypothetical protein [Janthinobacterium fluminis]